MAKRRLTNEEFWRAALRMMRWENNIPSSRVEEALIRLAHAWQPDLTNEWQTRTGHALDTHAPKGLE